MEMTGRGKRGKPKGGFPLFPPPLEIAVRFPHSHRLDGDVPLTRHEPRIRNYGKEPLLGLGYRGVAFRCRQSSENVVFWAVADRSGH